MHPYKELPGSAPIGNGVYLGGNLKDIEALVRDGEAQATDFKFMHGCVLCG